MTEQERKQEIRQRIIDGISDYIGTAPDELHNNLFNTDYYIIGTYQAKKWCGEDTFDIIYTIKEYEQFNFGEVATDLTDPEKVVNMYVYIIGEEILNEFQELLYDVDSELTEEICEEIIEELEG